MRKQINFCLVKSLINGMEYQVETVIPQRREMKEVKDFHDFARFRSYFCSIIKKSHFQSPLSF